MLEELCHQGVCFHPQFSHNGVVEGCGVAVGAEPPHDIVSVMLEEFGELDVLEVLAVILGPFLVQEGDNRDAVLEKFHAVQKYREKHNA